MNRFITLIQCNLDGSYKNEVLINIDHISAVYPLFDSSSKTRIILNGSKFIDVRESIIDVTKLIEIGESK